MLAIRSLFGGRDDDQSTGLIITFSQILKFLTEKDKLSYEKVYKERFPWKNLKFKKFRSFPKQFPSASPKKLRRI